MIKKFLLLFVGLPIILFGMTCAYSEQEISRSLKIILTVEKNTYVFGEPVKLLITALNIDSKPIQVSLCKAVYTICISSGKEFEEYRYSQEEEKISPAWKTLNPGEKIEICQTILFRIQQENNFLMKDYTFKREGFYTIKVIYKMGNNIERESNSVKIEVRVPKGGDSLVWEKIKSPEFAEFLQLGYVLEKAKESEVIKTLKQIIEKYPASTYTPYIKEALIKYYRTKPDKIPEEKEYLKTLQKD